MLVCAIWFYRLLRIAVLLLIPTFSYAVSLEVQVNGLDPQLTREVKADLTLEQAITEPKLTVKRIKNLYDLAPQEINETLEAAGYYSSEINGHLSSSHDHWRAVFNINRGAPTLIHKVDLSVTGAGASDRRLKKYLVTPRLIPGHILTHTNYEDTKTQLLVDLNAQGYLRADFDRSVIEVDRAAQQADIKFDIETGDLYRFGKVTFLDTRYPDNLLIRYVPFHYGEPYSIDKLIQLQNNLESADLFSKIRLDPEVSDDSQDLYVPINVRLTARPRNRYSGSVGYGTDTGIRGSLAWLHRFASPAGHKLQTSISGSPVLSYAKINYIIPGKEAATDHYILGVVGQIEKFDDMYSRKGEVFASKVIKRHKLESIYGISYFTESFHLTSFDPTQNRHYLLPSARWIWIDPHTMPCYEYGTRLELSLRGGIKGVGSDNSVLEAVLRTKHIVPLSNPLRLILRGDLGAISSENFNNLPPSLRFYTGGDTSVRGYIYNTLGPQVNGEVVGGKYLLIGSAELEYMIYKKFSAAVFYDVGNATNVFIAPLANSPGVGLRYKTPIGDFRLDVAKPLNQVKNKPWRVHFVFGKDF